MIAITFVSLIIMMFDWATTHETAQLPAHRQGSTSGSFVCYSTQLSVKTPMLGCEPKHCLRQMTYGCIIVMDRLSTVQQGTEQHKMPEGYWTEDHLHWRGMWRPPALWEDRRYVCPTGTSVQVQHIEVLGGSHDLRGRLSSTVSSPSSLFRQLLTRSSTWLIQSEALPIARSADVMKTRTFLFSLFTYFLCTHFIVPRIYQVRITRKFHSCSLFLFFLLL